MASTYSQYKIELVGTGEQAGTWGTTTNNNFGSATPGTYQGFEQAIGGRADVTMSGTTTLSLTNSNAAQDARALYLNLSGTLSGAADLVVPALQKSYLVKNGTTGGFAVTIKVTGQTGVSIPNGKTVWVYNNGTDVVTAVDFIPEIATTTVDTTNIEVTNIKAKDGTAAGSIADSTGVVTLASSVLTTTDINGGTIDGAIIGGASAAAGSFTTLNTSGQVVFNDAGADVDFRVEGDTEPNLLFVDAGNDRVGIGTNTPTSKLEVYTGTGAFNAVQAQFNASNTPIVFACNNSNGDAYLGHNTVQVSGTDGQTYAITNAAAKIRMNGGSFQFNIAPSGTAGDPITFTQAMTLDASGNLLVGKTATSFSTAGTVLYPNGTADFIANGDVAIDINRLVDDGSLIRFYQAGTTVGSIGTTGGELYIDFGGSTGGAVTSRTLDDYEEGTWTPVLQGSTTAGTYVYDTDRTNGIYIKIGKMVTVFGVYRVLSVTSAGTGDGRITGLPFTSAVIDTSWNRSPGILRVQSGPTLANNGYFCATEGFPYLVMALQGVATWATIPVTDADFVDTIWFFQITYEAA
jgi:hypothetical protein